MHRPHAPATCRTANADTGTRSYRLPVSARGVHRGTVGSLNSAAHTPQAAVLHIYIHGYMYMLHRYMYIRMMRPTCSSAGVHAGDNSGDVCRQRLLLPSPLGPPVARDWPTPLPPQRCVDLSRPPLYCCYLFRASAVPLPFPSLTPSLSWPPRLLLRSNLGVVRSPPPLRLAPCGCGALPVWGPVPCLSLFCTMQAFGPCSA